MQDRPGKACGGGEFGIRVQRVAVTAHPVQKRLLRRHRDGQLEVRSALRRLRRRRRSAFAAEPALAAREDRPLLRPQRRAVRGGDRRLRPDHRGLALVPDVGEPGDRDGRCPTVGSAQAPTPPRWRAAPCSARCRCRGTSPMAARSCESSAPHCRTSAVPAGCRRRDSATHACPSGPGPRRARGGRAGYRYWSRRIRPVRARRRAPRRD